MKNLISITAALSLSLALASPAAAFGEEPGVDHGPVPFAVVQLVAGAAFWVVSIPFTALMAPLHVMDSFDEMVLEPVRCLTGISDLER